MPLSTSTGSRVFSGTLNRCCGSGSRAGVGADSGATTDGVGVATGGVGGGWGGAGGSVSYIWAVQPVRTIRGIAAIRAVALNKPIHLDPLMFTHWRKNANVPPPRRAGSDSHRL